MQLEGHKANSVDDLWLHRGESGGCEDLSGKELTFLSYLCDLIASRLSTESDSVSDFLTLLWHPKGTSPNTTDIMSSTTACYSAA